MQRKIRVLHVYKTFYPMTQGGIQESIRQICLNTHARGVESRVLTLTPSPVGHPIRVDDIEVYQAKQLFELASCGFSLSALTQFGQLARWADVLHYHFPWPFADLLHFLRRPDKPSVVTYHSDIVRQRHLSKVYAPLMHAFLDATDIIVPTSPNYTRSSPILRRFRNKLRVIPLGLNECRYPPPGRACPLPFEDREEFFLFVGVFRAYKGLHILLEAAQNASFKVVIAGRGPMEKRLKAQAVA
ncbi:glycosyltransferase [Ectothiorhodospira haloalkaliphila]|uniref:glycosyltransferase n=1 Tax=Ectothiorhodospira haloalkaliphila TaxID=421628 RepID=UPI0004AD83AA|nr:glycosyltransferase [Ectothiorhodospira haloalkaliphila]